MITHITNSGNLNTSRNIHSATLLQNNNVLIIGGQTFANASGTNTAEIYNVSTGTFSTTGSMSVNRYYHSSILLNNGKVLVIGGVSQSTTYKSTEVYDPQAGTFQGYGNMNSQRMWPFTVKLSDTKFLIVGGSSIAAYTTFLSSVEILDSSNATFTLAGNMNVARLISAANLLSNNKVLVIGGNDGTNNLSTSELYDVSAGTFSNSGSMSISRGYNAKSVTLSSGKVLVFLGNTNSKIVEIYTP